MVGGFNHDVRHRGRAFHVQTEDSGSKSSRVVTHLFSGGDVLITERTDYTHLLGQPELDNAVRSLMEEQHKKVLRALVKGAYDAIIDGG